MHRAAIWVVSWPGREDRPMELVGLWEDGSGCFLYIPKSICISELVVSSVCLLLDVMWCAWWVLVLLGACSCLLLLYWSAWWVNFSSFWWFAQNWWNHVEQSMLLSQWHTILCWRMTPCLQNSGNALKKKDRTGALTEWCTWCQQALTLVPCLFSAEWWCWSFDLL